MVSIVHFLEPNFHRHPNTVIIRIHAVVHVGFRIRCIIHCIRREILHLLRIFATPFRMLPSCAQWFADTSVKLFHEFHTTNTKFLLPLRNKTVYEFPMCLGSFCPKRLISEVLMFNRQRRRRALLLREVAGGSENASDVRDPGGNC